MTVYKFNITDGSLYPTYAPSSNNAIIMANDKYTLIYNPYSHSSEGYINVIYNDSIQNYIQVDTSEETPSVELSRYFDAIQVNYSNKSIFYSPMSNNTLFTANYDINANNPTLTYMPNGNPILVFTNGNTYYLSKLSGHIFREIELNITPNYLKILGDKIIFMEQTYGSNRNQWNTFIEIRKLYTGEPVNSYSFNRTELIPEKYSDYIILIYYYDDNRFKYRVYKIV